MRIQESSNNGALVHATCFQFQCKAFLFLSHVDSNNRIQPMDGLLLSVPPSEPRGHTCHPLGGCGGRVTFLGLRWLGGGLT